MHGVDAAVVGVEEIEGSRVLEDSRHLQALVEIETGFVRLVDQETHADDEIVTDATANLFVYQQAEAAAVFDATTELVAALIGHR